MTQPTNFTPEKCLAYAFLSKMGDLKLQLLSQPWTPEEYKERFEQLADQLAENLSVWRNVDDELPPDEVECVFETNDRWRFVGEFRERRGFIIHKHGYEMIKDIKKWQPINLPKEV